MKKIISVVLRKGGTGKTTTLMALADGLAIRGEKVLVVDLDSQMNMSMGYGNFHLSKLSIYNVLCEKGFNIYDAIQPVPKSYFAELEVKGKLDIIPANAYVDNLQKELDLMMRKEERLLKALTKLNANDYDYILIDCPPTLGVLTTNALAASDSVLIPVQCEYYSLEGVTQLLNTILLTQSKINPKLDIEGVLLTMLDGRTLVGLEVVEDVRKFFKEKVFNTIIPRLVRLVEAPSHGKPILEYDPKCRGALAYINLAKEVIERDGKQEESAREGA